MTNKISFYPSELMLPFVKLKAELAQRYPDTPDYRAAHETAEQFIETARQLVDRKLQESEEDG